MSKRTRIVLLALGIALIAFVVFMAMQSYYSILDVVGIVVFVICMLLVAASQLKVSAPVEGYRGLPRPVWVIFASLAAAFAGMILIALAAMPFVGFSAFETAPSHRSRDLLLKATRGVTIAVVSSREWKRRQPGLATDDPAFVGWHQLVWGIQGS